MSKIKQGAAVLAAGSLLTAGVGAAVAATASPASHTLKFNSVQTSQKNLDKKGHFADADKDVQKGKVIGFDIVNGTYHAKSQSITVDFAASLKGGIIYGQGTGTFKPNAFTGTITGGTGKFKGAKGTLTGSAYGKGDNNEHLTITYH